MRETERAARVLSKIMSNGICVSMCADFILDYHESMGSYLNRGEGYRKLNAKSREKLRERARSKTPEGRGQGNYVAAGRC